MTDLRDERLQTQEPQAPVAGINQEDTKRDKRTVIEIPVALLPYLRPLTPGRYIQCPPYPDSILWKIMMRELNPGRLKGQSKLKETV